MKYSLRRPCYNCPFRREGGIRLHPERAREIAEGSTSNPGFSFTCHETTVDAEGEDGESDRVDGPNAQHCAGALILAEKTESYTQMMRIAGRLGMWDPDKMRDKNAVFDSVEEMVEAQEVEHRRLVAWRAR